MKPLKTIALAAALVFIGANTHAEPNVSTLYGRSGDWRIYAYRAGMEDTDLFGNVGCFMTRSVWGPYDLSVVIPPIGWWSMELPSTTPKGTVLDVPFMLDGKKSGSKGQRFAADEGRILTILEDVAISALGNVSTLTLVLNGKEESFSLDGFGPATKLTRECFDKKGRK